MGRQYTGNNKFFTRKDIKTILLGLISGTFTALLTFYFSLKSIDYENSLQIINSTSSEMELLIEAQEYYNQREYLKALTIYHLEKLNNNPIALNNIAYMYENGIYVQKDIKEARNYYELASKLGNNIAEDNWILFNIAYPESYENLLKILAFGYFSNNSIVESFISEFYCSEDKGKALTYFYSLSLMEQIDVLKLQMYEQKISHTEEIYYGEPFIEYSSISGHPKNVITGFETIPVLLNGKKYLKTEILSTEVNSLDYDAYARNFIYRMTTNTTFILVPTK